MSASAYHWSDLPPVGKAAMAVDANGSNARVLMAVHLRRQRFLPLVLCGSPVQLRAAIKESHAAAVPWWSERFDGVRNSLHVVVDAAAAKQRTASESKSASRFRPASP